MMKKLNKVTKSDNTKNIRILDKKGAKRCFVRYPDEDNDDNLAVLNRLLRAAGFKVVDV